MTVKPSTVFGVRYRETSSSLARHAFRTRLTRSLVSTSGSGVDPTDVVFAVAHEDPEEPGAGIANVAEQFGQRASLPIAVGGAEMC